MSRFTRYLKVGPFCPFQTPSCPFYSLMNHFEIFLTEGQIFLTGQRENKTNKVLLWGFRLGYTSAEKLGLTTRAWRVT